MLVRMGSPVLPDPIPAPVPLPTADPALPPSPSPDPALSPIPWPAAAVFDAVLPESLLVTPRFAPVVREDLSPITWPSGPASHTVTTSPPAPPEPPGSTGPKKYAPHRRVPTSIPWMATETNMATGDGRMGFLCINRCPFGKQIAPRSVFVRFFEDVGEKSMSWASYHRLEIMEKT